jgi:hypothetical protein
MSTLVQGVFPSFFTMLEIINDAMPDKRLVRGVSLIRIPVLMSARYRWRRISTGTQL